MILTKDHIKRIQTFLNDTYHYALSIDGIAGKQTLSAISAIAEIPLDWPHDRMLVGCIQYMCFLKKIECGAIDGFWGAQTDYAYDVLIRNTQPWRDDEGIGAIPVENAVWPIQTQSQLISFYGKVGEHQTRIKSPYPLRIAWNTTQVIHSFYCHEKVALSIDGILAKVLNHYGQDDIAQLGLDLWGGCLNVRKMRGGTNWSTHAWGIAIDWDPEHNQLRWGKDKARFAKPVYDYWWKCWEDEGWVSLGRTRNYDWMHIQAAKVS